MSRTRPDAGGHARTAEAAVTAAALPPPSPESTASLGAILLAGGRATRVGGAAKPLFAVGDRTLLQRAVDAACTRDAHPVTVVGPPPPRGTIESGNPARPVRLVREDPPFGGPAAAVVAALASWETSTTILPEWTLVLACDLPGADAASARLVRDMMLLPPDTDGLCLADGSSRPQWLTGVYRTPALLRCAAALPDAGAAASVRALLSGLRIALVAAPAEETADVDTWEDLSEARRRWPAPEEETR